MEQLAGLFHVWKDYFTLLKLGAAEAFALKCASCTGASELSRQSWIHGMEGGVALNTI